MFDAWSTPRLYNLEALAAKDGNTHIAVYTINAGYTGRSEMDTEVSSCMDALLQSFQFDGYKIVDVKFASCDAGRYVVAILYR